MLMTTVAVHLTFPTYDCNVVNSNVMSFVVRTTEDIEIDFFQRKQCDSEAKEQQGARVA